MTDTYPDSYLDLAMMRVPTVGWVTPTARRHLVWLASPPAGYVTGQTIAVDGGITIA